MMDEIKGTVRVCGEEILCDNEELAYAIANFIESDKYPPCVYCYGPEEDERDDCVNEPTKWWAVYINY